MVTNEGAVPLAAEILSQLPPLKVLPATVQFSVPVPALRTCRIWLEKLVPPVLVVKLNCPGILSKNALPAPPTIRVTGTVNVVDTPVVNTTCPE